MILYGFEVNGVKVSRSNFTTDDGVDGFDVGLDATVGGGVRVGSGFGDGGCGDFKIESPEKTLRKQDF